MVRSMYASPKSIGPSPSRALASCQVPTRRGSAEETDAGLVVQPTSDSVRTAARAIAVTSIRPLLRIAASRFWGASQCGPLRRPCEVEDHRVRLVGDDEIVFHHGENEVIT